MVETDIINQRGLLHDNLSNAIRQLILSAKPVKRFEDSSGKVELLEDMHGNLFVGRVYDQPALRYFSDSGFDFKDAWDLMHREFQKVGIEIVPSFHLDVADSNVGKILVVSKYLEDARPVIDASVETKIRLATSLGNLLYQSEVIPKGEMLRPNMFHLTHGPDGEERVVLTDVDPYLYSAKNSSPEVKSALDGKYIDGVCSLFWDYWCRQDEKEEVIKHFVEALAKSSDLDVIHSKFTSGAFGRAHAMKEGIDARSLS